MKNEIDKVSELSTYLLGAGDSLYNGNREFSKKLNEASEWLDKLADHMCGQGYIGCRGGIDCSSDHK